MGHSLSLAAFLLLTAQIQEPRLMPVPSEPGSVPRVISSTAPAPRQTPTYYSPTPQSESPSSGEFRLFPRLRDRISNLFGGSSPAPSYQQPQVISGQPTASYRNPPVVDRQPTTIYGKPQTRYTKPQASDPPHQTFRNPPLTNKESPITGAIEQPGKPLAQQGVQTKFNLKLSPKFENKVGHDEKYQWVTGQLFHLGGKSSAWVVRYAVDGEVDRLGGYVVLGGNVDMKQFRSGDLVSVSGTIVNTPGAFRNLNMPVYQAQGVHLIERQ